MITLDINLDLLSQYTLSTKRVNQNAYQNIDATATSAAGSSSAASLKSNSKTLNIDISELTVDELVKVFKFESPRNRFLILSQLKKEDLSNLLYLLNDKQLLLSMKFFTKETLIKFVDQLPKEEFNKFITKMFPMEELLKMLPQKELQKFMSSEKINKNDLAKVIQSIPAEILAKIIEGATGQQCTARTSVEMLEQIKGIDHSKLIEGIQSLPNKELRGVIGSLIEENPDLFNIFTKQSLDQVVEKASKPDMLRGMTAIKPEYLVKMLTDLPKELLQQVDTLIDPELLMEYLVKFNSDILEEVLQQAL